MIRLKGTITARAPINVTYPDATGLPRTPHGEVMLEGGTLRGPLRKAALRALRYRLAEDQAIPEGVVFTLADVYMLGEGVDVSRDTNNENSEFAAPGIDAKLRQINPFMHLFGRWKLSSQLSVSALLAPASCVTVAGRGARADMFERDSREVEALSADDRKKLAAQLASARSTQLEIDDLNKQLKTKKRDIVGMDKGADKDRLSKEIKALEAQIKETKNSREGAAESVKHPLAGVEAIAPGTELTSTISIIQGGDTELGLLIMALSELAREPFLGGHRQTGMGEFSAEYEVTTWPKGSLKPHSLGRISFSPDDGFEIDGETLHAAYQNFIKAIGTFDFKVYRRSQIDQG